MRQRSFSSYFNAQSGVAAIEFAFILPVMLLLYFGMMDLTSLVVNNRKVTTVASAVADLTSQNRTTILKSQIDDYMNVSDLVLNPAPPSGVTVRVFGYRPSGGAPTLIWQTGNGEGPGCADPSTAGFTELMTAGNDLIVAQACMTFVPLVANFLGKSILGDTSFSVGQSVVVRPRATLTLNCEMTSGGAACS
jgi:Flp pilus assembly protein TadG